MIRFKNNDAPDFFRVKGAVRLNNLSPKLRAKLGG